MATQEHGQTREAWDAIARGYDEFVTPTHMQIGHDALTRAGVGPGVRFLDVAAGSGALSIPAARLGARVVATDLSPAMTEALAARARADGVAVETRLMDGHALDFADDCFEVAGSQYGVMLFPDLPRALGEMARVTRPGGRVLMVVYGPPTRFEILGFFLAAVQAVVPGFTGPPQNLVALAFQVAEPEKLRQALARAGLNDVSVEPLTQHTEFGSGRQMWDWVVNSNPIGAMLVADLTDEQERAVQLELDGMLRERSGAGGTAVLTDLNLIGIGTK